MKLWFLLVEHPAAHYILTFSNGFIRTVPDNPDIDIMDDEQFKSFKEAEIVATYDYTRAAYNDD